MHQLELGFQFFQSGIRNFESEVFQRFNANCCIHSVFHDPKINRPIKISEINTMKLENFQKRFFGWLKFQKGEFSVSLQIHC